MKERATTNRIFFIDISRFIAIVFVIILHVYISDQVELKLGYPFSIGMCIPIFMICSGFNLSLSDDKKFSGEMEQGLLPYLNSRWRQKSFWHRSKRLLIPFLPLFVIYLLYLLQTKFFVSATDFLYYLLVTGWGPGSYYIPALLQIYLLWPFLYYFSKKLYGVTFGLVLLLTVIFEFLVNQGIFPELFYRYYIHRHLPFLLCGIIMKNWYQAGDFLKPNNFSFFRQYPLRFLLLLGAFCCGLYFIISNQYYGIEPFLFKNWKRSSVPTALYIFPFFVFLAILSEKIKLPTCLKRIISELSKASFHIYLVQMFYYLFPFSQQGFSAAWIILRNLLICLVVGYVYYLLTKQVVKAYKFKK